MALNKQPIFTSTPILRVTTINPSIPSTLNPVDNVTDVYACDIEDGCLIERINIVSAAIPGEETSDKTIYLCIYTNDDTAYAVYKTVFMAAATVSDIVHLKEEYY